MRMLIRFIFSCLIFYLLNIFNEGLHAQDITQNKKKLQKIANEYFNNEEFSKALPLLLELDTLVPNNFDIKYDIGACYLNTPYEKTKGIPYLEFALKNGENLLPSAVFYDLGTLYHLNYQFDEAINFFNRFIEISSKTEPHFTSAKKMLTTCNNAKEIYAHPLQIDINNLDSPVNSENSETTPLISANEESIYFTRSFSKTYGQLEIEFMKKIYCSVLKNKKWQEPFEIFIENPPEGMQISLAGNSPDGEFLYFSIGNDVSADIYSCRIVDGKYIDIIKMPEIINSPFWEGKLSVTSDGHELYFSSNRTSGYGGKDIYKVTKEENENWTNLQNLGPSVNTEFDEDAPFIHPDNKTLYFSSNGHNTMGGFDIFLSSKTDSNNNWTEPANIGYPINTTSDDMGFVISADGNTAYLSSAQNSQYGKYDIYKVVLHNTIYRNMGNCDMLKENNHCFVFYEKGTLDLDSTSLAYEWDLGDGTKIKGMEAEHCFEKAGQYFVKLNVIDTSTGNLYFNEASYNFVLEDIEQVYINSVDTCFVNKKVQFDGIGTNLKNFIIREYYWDFGNGKFAKSPYATNVFPKTGNYPVRLEVTSTEDTAGNVQKACVLKNIVVVEPKNRK